MNNNMSFLFWFIVAIVTSSLPIPFIIYYTKTKHLYWILLSFISYCVMLYSYTITFTSGNVATLYPLIKILHVILVVVSSIVLFNSKLNIEVLSGLILAIMSIYILSKNIKM